MIASYDFFEGWTFDGEPSAVFGIRFTDGGKQTVHPVSLSFGYELTVNGQASETHVWPPSHITIRELSPNRVFSYRLGALPDDEIVLKVWANNARETGESEINWIVPRPAKPYDSWAWDETNSNWQAPVPYPADGGDYTWDEETGDWLEVVDEAV